MNKNKYTSSSKIKVQPNWNFSSLYSGITDPQLEKDADMLVRTYMQFAKKYSSPKQIERFTTEVTELKNALDDWQYLTAQAGLWKPVWYLHLVGDIDSQNSKIKALYTKLDSKLTVAANHILFFNLALAKISKENQNRF